MPAPWGFSAQPRCLPDCRQSTGSAFPSSASSQGANVRPLPSSPSVVRAAAANTSPDSRSIRSPENWILVTLDSTSRILAGLTSNTMPVRNQHPQSMRR